MTGRGKVKDAERERHAHEGSWHEERSVSMSGLLSNLSTYS